MDGQQTHFMDAIAGDLQPIKGLSNLKDKSIEESFEEFHKNNPHIYRYIVSLCRKLKSKGVIRYGMKAIFEVIRFNYLMSTNSSDGFKMNNNFTALYARLVMEQEPELDGFFAIRQRNVRQ